MAVAASVRASAHSLVTGRVPAISSLDDFLLVLAIRVPVRPVDDLRDAGARPVVIRRDECLPAVNAHRLAVVRGQW